MSVPAQYDHATKALSAALASRDIGVVVNNRESLEFIKLRARQLNDRQLLADATEFHMRVERWLGILLIEEKKSGRLLSPGGAHRRIGRSGPRPVSLNDIGVTAHLSMKAQHAAALDQKAFDAAVSEMRARMAAGKAKLVSAVTDAQKTKSRTSGHKRNAGFRLPLGDGTRLGVVKVGKLRSRIEALGVELRILQAISDHVGEGADALASVEDTLSEAVITDIIRVAEEAGR